MAGVTSINLDRVYSYVEAQAFKAIAAVLPIAVVNVQKHAPVRSIFKGTTFRAGKQGFRQPITRRLTTPDGESRVGHANSSIPLFRKGRGSKSSFITGDFRRLDIATNKLATIGTGFQASTLGKGGPSAFGSFDRGEVAGRKGSTDLRELALFTRVKGGKLQLVDPSRVKAVSAEDIGKLTSRGRFEVKSGRANFRHTTFDSSGTAISAGRTVRVGGRLKGEIHSEGPVLQDGIIWGYVVSATKDPDTGHLYPLDQEFGSAHNRPHPFMRPGLHDSRGALRREIRESVRKGPQ